MKSEKETQEQRISGKTVRVKAIIMVGGKMGDFNNVKKRFDAMMQMLKFTSNETLKILEKNAIRPLEHHLKAIESQADEIQAMKLEIQKQMIQKGDKMEAVQK